METRDRIIRTLVERPLGLGLSEIGAAVGMAGPPVLHHLKALSAEGVVERFLPAGASRPKYRLRPFLSIVWIDPASGTFASWSSKARVDWRYPLVSRLSDPAAQESATAFLRIAEENGIFHPHLASREKRRAAKWTKGVPAGLSDADRRRYFGLRIVAYGSAARGDMGPRSDVDLLALTGVGLEPALQDALRDAAAEANLSTPLRVDLHVFREGEARRVAPRLAAAVEEDGFVIHSTYEHGPTDPLFPEAQG